MTDRDKKIKALEQYIKDCEERGNEYLDKIDELREIIVFAKQELQRLKENKEGV